MDDWSTLRIFLAVAESGSFSGAARRLGVGQPTVSRRIAELEEAVGRPLFVRGVEGTVLTSEAQALLPPAQRMDEAAAEWRRVLDAKEPAPRGRVRLTAPPGVAHIFVAPFALRLRAAFPEIELAVHASIGYLDLGRGEADLAIRSRPAKGHDLVELAQREFAVSAAVSPTLAAALPRACRADQVPWIAWAEPYAHLPPNPQLNQLIDDFRPAFSSDSFLVQLRAAQLGLGAMPLSPRCLLNDLGLVPVDSVDLSAYGDTIHIVASKTAMRSARVRAVADSIVEAFMALEG